MKTAVFLTFRVQNRMGQNMGQPLTHPLTHTRKNSCGTNGIRQGNPAGFRFPFAFFLSVGHAPFFVYSGAVSAPLVFYSDPNRDPSAE